MRRTKKVMARKKIDIKYLGIPNICFSLTEKDDKREKKFVKQRMEKGFDSSETWALDSTIARFILPRLKCFREQVGGYPYFFSTIEEWHEILDKMILAFELSNKDDLSTKKQQRQIEQGLKLFAKWFRALWW
jgi:hypothetical protein